MRGVKEEGKTSRREDRVFHVKSELPWESRHLPFNNPNTPQRAKSVKRKKKTVHTAEDKESVMLGEYLEPLSWKFC